MEEALLSLADRLWAASSTRIPIQPLREIAEKAGVSADVESAYAIQRINKDRRRRAGDRIVGRKIGLTARAVQQQLGVDSPDYGVLWSSGAYGDGDEIQIGQFIQPKVEAEVALVLGRDLNEPTVTAVDVIRATDFALAALEIVDSRIEDWRIGLFDTIADNASAGAFVLSADPVRLDQVRLRNSTMTMKRNEKVVSQGHAGACLGHPLNAAVWLARTLAYQGEPLKAGDIILTGALGPMVAANRSDLFEASIDGLGGISVRFQ